SGASGKRPQTSVPLRATRVSPTVRSVLRLAWKTSPTWFFEESTPSIMRISTDCPAGMVTTPFAAAGAGAGAGAAAGTGVGAAAGASTAAGAGLEDRPVKVSATMSLVLKV